MFNNPIIPHHLDSVNRLLYSTNTMITQTKTGERYYTLRACAAELGVSHQMVASLIKNGKMKRKAFKAIIYRIPESEVLRLKKIYGRD